MNEWMNEMTQVSGLFIATVIHLLRHSSEGPGAPNDRFRGNICSEPSRMAKIFGSPRTAKNFENVSW